MPTCYKNLRVLLYSLSYLNSASYAGPADGSNADNIAMRVRQLYQDDLPSMYQRGECVEGDLRQRTGGDGNGGGSINRPFGFLITMLILISIFILLY